MAFHVPLNRPIAGGIIAVINELGEEIPGASIVSDGYKRNQNLPRDHPNKLDLPAPDEFKLVPMTLADVMPGSAYAPSDAKNSRP